MLVCFLSKTFSEFEAALENYAPLIAKNRGAKVFALIREEPPRAIKQSFSVAVISEKGFHETVSSLYRKLPGVDRAFTGYGGLRNACLLAGASLGEDVVFFDSDTRPANDCVELYASLFSSSASPKKKIIKGKYVGHAGGITTLLLALEKTLEDCAESRLNSDEVQRRIAPLFRGIPPSVSSPFPCAGLNGGNAGVSAAAAAQYCFFPTSYRVEDGCFETFAPRFLGEGAVFEPGEAETPLVFHEKKPGAPSTLRENLLSEGRGSVIAQLIDASLYAPQSQSFSATDVRKAAAKAFAASALPFLKEKSEAAGLREAAREIGGAEAKEFEALLALTASDFEVSVGEAIEAQQLFFFAQRNWAGIVSLSKENKMFSGIF